MTSIGKCMALALAVAGAMSLPAEAQVVREDGAKSIAGVLFTVPAPQVASAEWTFQSIGGVVLFASLDADIYRKMSSHDHAMLQGTLGTASAEEDDGGPGLFRLLVLDQGGNVLCSASRPAPPPGWQRDPRLACYLPATLNRSTPVYRLRVELASPEGERMQPYYPFLLNVSLRAAATSGIDLTQAFAQSGF